MRMVHYITGKQGKAGYGIIEDDYVCPLKNCDTPGDVFDAVKKGKVKTRGKIKTGEIQYLPPAGQACRLYCAGLNYRDHAEEVKMPVPANPVFFTKSHGALCGGNDAVLYPRQVALLDYEIELAVIIGRTICKNTPLTEENLHEYILGIAIMNDVSARDVQLSRGQWFLGKSFRTFAPLGPVLQVFDRDVAERLYDLTLSLSVSNSSGRRYENKKQHGSTGDMIFPISRLLHELKVCVDLIPGDVVATGTPAGVAMSSPGRLETRVADILGIPQGRRIARFLAREQKTNGRYLQPGDVMESRIYSSDCVVDLGVQRNEIVWDE